MLLTLGHYKNWGRECGRGRGGARWGCGLSGVDWCMNALLHQVIVTVWTLEHGLQGTLDEELLRVDVRIYVSGKYIGNMVQELWNPQYCQRLLLAEQAASRQPTNFERNVKSAARQYTHVKSVCKYEHTVIFG